MKKITKDVAEAVLFKMDTKGMGYALCEGYMDDLEGTELDAEFKAARDAYKTLQDKLETLREKFGIEVS